MIIKGGVVYDPANGIFGEEMDICVEGGKVVEDARGEEIDARGLLVMPGGVDAHSHIAGPKVNTGRIMCPNDGRMGIEPRTGCVPSFHGVHCAQLPCHGLSLCSDGLHHCL